MPLMSLKQVADLYGCDTPDTLFMRNIPLESAESVSQKTNAVIWLNWLTNSSSSFSRSVIDMVKKTLGVKTVSNCTGQTILDQLHTVDIEDQRNISSGYRAVTKDQTDRRSNIRFISDQAQLGHGGSHVVHGRPNSGFSG